MKYKITRCIALLLMGAVSTGHTQSITPFILNAGGGTGVVSGYTFDYSIGEMAAVSTLSSSTLIVTQGLLQPSTTMAILPVTLIRFQGAKINGYNKLDWATGTESGNTVFELQRSYDAVSFTDIYTLPVRNFANGSTYTYNDADPFQKQVYYRLKIIESDGVVRYSNIVVLYSYQLSYWSVFPNPAQPAADIHITLQNSNNIKTVMATLTDVAGRIVYTKQLPLGSGYQTLTLKAPVATGTYLLNLTGIPNSVSQKIIIR